MYSFDLDGSDLQEKWVVPLYRARHVLNDLEAGRVKVKPVHAVADIASGTYIRGYHDTGKKYLRVDNIRPYICNLNSDDLVFVNPADPSVTQRVITTDEDVLLARTGTLGKASLAIGPVVDCVMSQHVTRLTMRPDAEFLPGYVAAFLNSDLGKYQLIYSGYGSTRLELTHGALQKVRIPVADEKLQVNVHTSVLSGIEHLYSSLGTYSDAVRIVENALGFSLEIDPGEDVFSLEAAGLDTMWTPRYYKPSYVRLVNSLQDWFRCSMLGQLAQISRGKGTRVSDYALRGIPFVRTTSLINFGIDPFPDHYASDDVHALFQQPVQSGDILFSIEGKIGQTAFLTEIDSCVFKNHIELVRVHADIDPMLIFLFLAGRGGLYQARKNMVVQATLPGMADRLRKLLVPIAPKDESRVRSWRSATERAVELGYEAVKLRVQGVKALRRASELVDDYLVQASGGT